MKNNIGVIGMAVMGSNLALNIADHGYRVAIFNRTVATAKKVYEANMDKSIRAYDTLKDFVDSLESPRKIILMVKAGEPVDMNLDQLFPLLDTGDIIMDGGNSYFKDTIRRSALCAEKGFVYLGVGISGGEEGARFGPAIMPGGERSGYESVAPILNAISAKVSGEPCCTYIGTDGAGHYVKMIHNGIEYGDMQLIAESYSLLKHAAGLSNQEINEVFTRWNQGKLSSFLIEISAAIFKEKDKETGQDLIDVILDRAAQKGTGKWTVDESIELGVNTSVITSAVFARFLSFMKTERVHASTILSYTGTGVEVSDKQALVDTIEDALFLSKVISYAQGFSLLKEAEATYHWSLDFAEIAKIWRGGCIIRAQFLNDITDAFAHNTDENLLLAPFFTAITEKTQGALRDVVAKAALGGISVPGFMNALSYFDGYRSASSNANLIQAQRDLFGAHTFERIDKEGAYHHEWPINQE